MLVDDRGAAGASVAEVVDAMEADLEVLVASVEDRILAWMQPINGESPAALYETLHRGVSAAVRDALARLRSHAELPQELPPDLIELARLYAGSRWELDGLADAALAGQEAFWERFYVVTERTLADPAQCWDAIKAARARLRGNPARVTELFRKACERELARDTDIEDSRLRAVLRTLDGHWVDPEELGYDLSSHHVAVVADTPRALDTMARRTKRQLLRVRGPDGGIWGWLGGPTRMSDGDLDALLASRGPSDTRVAFGEPAEGIAGFAASHHQALEANAIAVATNQRAVRFADCRVLIAVLRDDGLAKGFIERELGELARPTEQMRALRTTLRTYLEHRQSVSATAALLRRDHKTIERQLRSTEHLLHHRLSDRSDEVLIALRVAEILRHRDCSPRLPTPRAALVRERSYALGALRTGSSQSGSRNGGSPAR